MFEGTITQRLPPSQFPQTFLTNPSKFRIYLCKILTVITETSQPSPLSTPISRFEVEIKSVHRGLGTSLETSIMLGELGKKLTQVLRIDQEVGKRL
jgi:hypothetical protein